ncbi:23S rRNA pseudouridine(1911/1915/1917) synthase RluD [Halieaceae bacterium IMCC14734]|uniref:Pseudouridine synthase n=1 Tax=Candidatus Litorirhabdus singularis TaxID=2518993 RepID=A0ABT3TLM1_9GAMM|nr:23S rRNA pseudouridine(1911/1915/1917) synthase RluD [Candidatus Litorirhabdus singularis]MCX2983198.1 23S rRNA pseudouridine(1911/1915/1917) synthase RluD [Candidatus Litorirhabdus singularis]
MAETIQASAVVAPEQHGLRLDQAAAELFPDYSRSRLQEWIRSGALSCDGEQVRPRDKVREGAVLELLAELEAEVSWLPESIKLDIVYEDASILVVNKQAGLVVHPAVGHRSGTLVNALLSYYPELVNLPRAGVVHRLDKDTSGLMVVARSLTAHADLVRQLSERTVKREYMAVCIGAMTGGGRIDVPLGRHPRDRKKMAVVAGGKEAITHYRVAERFGHHTAISVRLETGRTHQIRVHMAHQHYPLIGDPTYGGRPRIPRGAEQPLIDGLRGFPRQALHARALGLIHPQQQELCEWEVPLPADMDELLGLLRRFDPVVPDGPAY